MSSLRDNLFLLARSNDDKGIETLFIRESGELDERDDNGLTALHICATYGCVEACAVLLKFGAKHSLQDFESGWTPLHRAFYFGNLKVSLLLIRAGAMIADEGESRDWRTGICSRRERWRSIRNLASWKANIDHDGLSPLDLLSSSLGENLLHSKRELLCTSVFSFGKADFTLGVPLPNSVENILRPRRIEHLSCESIVQIVASRFHSVALTRGGEVYSWGHGRAGRLGLGDENTQPEPRLIASLTGIVVRMISAGVNHTLAVTNVGDLFSWGSDRFGQLGYGGGDAGKGSFSPRKIDNLKKSFVIAIAAGDAHSVCFTDNGEIYSWGCNKDGQLGVPLLERGGGTGGGSGSCVPKRVHLKGTKMTAQTKRENKFQVLKVHCPLLQIVASKSSTLLLRRPDDYDSVKGKGRYVTQVNEVYQWGHGSPIPSRVMFSRGAITTSKGSDPTMDRFFGHHTVAPIDIVQLSAGQYHNVALSSMGHVYTWGLGSDQLGHGSLENRLSVPQLLETLLPENGGGKVVMISAAVDRTCVVSDVGDLYTWGATSAKGILGLGSGLYQPIPKLVGGIKRAVSVAAGSDYTLVLTSATVPAMPFSDASCNVPQSNSFLNTTVGNMNTKSMMATGNLVVVPGSRRISSQTGPTRRSVMERHSSSSESSDTSDHESSSEDDTHVDAIAEESESEEGLESEDEREGVNGNITDQIASRSNDTSARCDASHMKEAASAASTGPALTRILSLQEMCERRIAESVDTKNVVMLLAHAESIGAKALTAFCTQFIHRNLDAILVQSRPSDLDILIADLGSSDLFPSFHNHNSSSTSNNASSSCLATPCSSSGKAAGGVIIASALRSGLTRKLSKEEDLEWHSRDAKHLGQGYGAGVKSEGRERVSSWSGRGSICDDNGNRQDPYSEFSAKTESTYEEYRHSYGHDDMSRGRSQSKDYDSLSGVMKLIRSVKKKLLSIAELEGRNAKYSLDELNDEQKDKMSRKEAYICELKRLKLICNRLEAEERVQTAAKLLREKATVTHGESSKLCDPSVGLNGYSISANSLVCVDLPPASCTAMASPKPASKSLRNVVEERNAASKSNTAADIEIPIIKSAAGQEITPNESVRDKHSTKPLTVTPSYVDWLKVTQTVDLPDSMAAPLDSHSQKALHIMGPKTAWGSVPTKSAQPSSSVVMDTGVKQSSAATMGSAKASISISHMSATGQTVLSPYTSRSSTSTQMSSSSNSDSISTNVVPSINSSAVLTSSDKSLHSSIMTRQPSVGLSLADLMITPKKKNKQSNVDTSSNIKTPDKTTLSSTKSAPFCPWLSLAPQTDLTNTSYTTGNTPDNSKPNSSLKLKPKTLNEIQGEEETARLQSNLSLLRGNDNPWYQERRKRADSIEAVIRSQVEEKALEQVTRTDEENAVREVDLFKRRERREKMKIAKNILNAKLNAKASESLKCDPSSTPLSGAGTASLKGNENATSKPAESRRRGGRGNGLEKCSSPLVATNALTVPVLSADNAPRECVPSSSTSSNSNPTVATRSRKPRGGRGSRIGEVKEDNTSEAKAAPSRTRSNRNAGEQHHGGRGSSRGRGNAGYAERSPPSCTMSAPASSGPS